MDATLGAAALGSGMSGGFGLLGSYLTYKYNQKLAAQQNEYNLNMWNLQNEYNSPQAQMKRFEEAGLNPALMYSQGNPGNATSAPLMVTPDAPQVSKDLQELGKAFNIEGLKTVIARRKQAEADARNSAVDAERNSRELHSEEVLGTIYAFDPNTGMFVERPRDPDGTRTVVANSAYYTNKRLADIYRTNSLLVPRINLIGSQKYLNEKRQELLSPQIRYWNFNTAPWRLKTNFWIGNVKNAAQAVSPFF